MRRILFKGVNNNIHRTVKILYLCGNINSDVQNASYVIPNLSKAVEEGKIKSLLTSIKRQISVLTEY